MVLLSFPWLGPDCFLLQVPPCFETVFSWRDFCDQQSMKQSATNIADWGSSHLNLLISVSAHPWRLNLKWCNLSLSGMSLIFKGERNSFQTVFLANLVFQSLSSFNCASSSLLEGLKFSLSSSIKELHDSIARWEVSSVVMGDGELEFHSEERAWETAATSMEGSRRTNYLIQTWGGSDNK